MTTLTTKALLVKLSINQWSTNKFDKKVTAATNKQYKAGQDAGRYTKRLVAKRFVEKIKKAANEARSFHYEQTLPWKDEGYRMLPSANYLSYTKMMRTLKSKFDRAVAGFVAAYPNAVQEAQNLLNGMFDPKDYPDAKAISAAYGFHTEVNPVPDAEDFRVSLQADEIAKIRKELKASLAKSQETAMADLWQRIYKVVEHASVKLSDPKAVFRDSLVENAVQLTKLLPKLNIAGDKSLDAMCKEIKKNLCKHTPDELRKNRKARKKVAKSAEDMLEGISNKMAGFTGGSNSKHA